MGPKKQRCCLLWWGLLFGLGFSSAVLSQQKYEIAITDISYLNVRKNWLLVPSEVDLRLTWTVMVKVMNNGREQIAHKEPNDLEWIYRVYRYEGDLEAHPAITETQKAGYVDFLNMRVGRKLYFKVLAYSGDNLVAESAPAAIVIGKGDGANGQLLGKDWLYYINPGRWQLLSVGKPEVYDKSTRLGKAAFIFLSLSTLFSFFVFLFYSSRTLFLGNIFPFKRSKRSMLQSFLLNCDKTYENRVTDKFKFVLNAWEMIAKKSRKVTDRAAKSVPQGLSATEKMASVDVACMEYWISDGDKAISTIEEIIAFPNDSKYNGKRNPDDMLTELVIKIEDSFHELVSTNGPGSRNGAPAVDMKNLIDEIYEPVMLDKKPLSRLRQWILRKGVFDFQKGLQPFPTSKIIRAGLEIHRMNGYRWLKPSEEVKRAFENRSSIEIDNLRRKSRIEWFWNYSALAPLVGLFGTVTGITAAFQQLSNTTVTPDFVSTIQQLSGGIFEALWTTIFGLANAIFFLLVYYYFKHKLDWIYAKWEEIYITITEKL